MPDHQKLLGRFTLERSLGSGGMSNVYLGRDEVLGRPVAVKLLRGGLYGDKGEDTAARFRREGRTAARLSHPNIVPVYDAGETLLARPETPDEEPVEVSYIVMEYVPGGDLGGLIEDHGPLDRDELCRLGAGAADALSHAHGRGVVHRDVKPQNILLDPSGRPKLTDFGIARALEATQATRTGNYLGTALYSSPEQLLGEKVSGKTDVYALGITLYQAATGRPPFQGTMMEIAQEHLKTSPVPPHQRIPGMDRKLSEAIMSCLAKDPNDRPTAEGFSATLLGVTGGLRPENLASPHETGQDRPEEGLHREETVAAAVPPAAGSPTPAAPGGKDENGAAGRFGRTATGRSRRNVPALVGLAVVSLIAALGGIMAFSAMDANSGSVAGNGENAPNVQNEAASGPNEAEVVEPAARQTEDAASETAASETAASEATPGGTDSGQSASDGTASDGAASGGTPSDESVAPAEPASGESASTGASSSGASDGEGSSGSGGDPEAAVDAVRLLYSSAVSGDYATSYGLLTENMKQTYAPTQEQWSGQFSTLRGLTFVEGPEVEVTGDLATVSGVTRAEHTDRTELNTAVWVLIRQDGEWRLDDQSVLNQELV